MKAVWVRWIGIGLLVVFTLGACVYTYYNGIFWRTAAIEKYLLPSLKEQYTNLKFHQIGSAWYNPGSQQYGITIVFNKVPVKYFFEFNSKTGTVEYSGTSASYAPVPIPYSTSWVNQNIAFTQSTMKKIRNTVGLQPGADVLTGGLGMADPEVVSVTSRGGVTLQSRKLGYQFILKEGVSDPSKWRLTDDSANNINIAEQGTQGKAIPWAKKTTKLGQTYHQWDARPGFTWFYFEKKGKYFVLRVVAPGVNKYPFPENILKDLKPVAGLT